ncbi:4-hydroxybenzoate octaprenyltransferase [Bartonella sp. DGB2]|uniref:4-hydroxybenzoate octaprenyltransferase n=1 Tax=Bartonella sp. DGB2 TaxID=3388426 RepID=UPI0039902934
MTEQEKPLSMTAGARVQDALSNHWVYTWLPRWFWPYAQLARWDRPIGWHLLMWPCFWGLGLAVAMPASPFSVFSFDFWRYLLLFWIGAVSMRGAGCTWNDLIDHKIDQKVERTRSRPLPARRLSRFNAKIFMLLQGLCGLVVLLQFNEFSIILGFASLGLIIIYPFMKRITYWPQFFLGLAFNWGAMMGFAVAYGALGPAALLLYAAGVLWTIGYDTIYAHQDKEDDALIGVRSTARLFGVKTAHALAWCYGGFVVLAGGAFFIAQVSTWAYFGLFFVAVHFIFQIWRLDINDSSQCLRLFYANTWVGALLFFGLLLAAISSTYG